MAQVKARHRPGALTAREVAELLGLNVNTIKRIDPAELPFWRVSTRGDRRYLLQDVEAYRDLMTDRPGWWQR